MAFKDWILRQQEFSSSLATIIGSLSGSVYSGSVLSASYAFTASYALNAGDVVFDTGSFVTTSSFNNFTSSYTTGSFTGSFVGDGSGLTGLPSTQTSIFIRRSDYTSSLDPNVNYLYCGQALSGSLESQNVWDISRLAISSSGQTLTQSTSSAAWTDRYIVTYT